MAARKCVSCASLALAGPGAFFDSHFLRSIARCTSDPPSAAYRYCLSVRPLKQKQSDGRKLATDH